MKEIINYNNDLIKSIQKTYGIDKKEDMWKKEIYTYKVDDEMFMYRALYMNLPVAETTTNVAISDDTSTYGY